MQSDLVDFVTGCRPNQNRPVNPSGSDEKTREAHKTSHPSSRGGQALQEVDDDSWLSVVVLFGVRGCTTSLQNPMCGQPTIPHWTATRQGRPTNQQPSSLESQT